MTFIIKDNIEQIGFTNEDYLFDIEGYNYIIERNSVFTRGNLITKNYDKLHYILKNYIEIDTVLLESLSYQAAITNDFENIANHDFHNQKLKHLEGKRLGLKTTTSNKNGQAICKKCD